MTDKETNQAKMIGILPSEGADPIPVRLADEVPGGGMIETNQAKMIGVLSSEGADPIPVSGMLYPSPISVCPCAFTPLDDRYDWFLGPNFLKNRTALTDQYFVASVLLPHGATITKLTLYGYRDDVASTMSLELDRVHRLGGLIGMGNIVGDWVSGWSSGYDDSIANAIVNNGIYSYALILTLDPNDSVDDVRFSGAKIEFTG